MKLNWKYILQKSLQISLKGLIILSLLYFLFVLVVSIVYKPMDVKVTNVTSSSATVSWYTKMPMTGVVSYKESEGFLPLFLTAIGAQRSYDDRDYAKAQKVCVEEFNKKIEKDLDSNFTVSGENYNCDKVKVKKLGRYYVHHVTITGLQEKSDYHFRVGNNLLGWKGESASFTTFETPTSVKEPIPVFGRVVSSEGVYSEDSLVYVTFKGNDNAVSGVYSSVTNENGGWYLDGGNIYSADGEILPLTPSVDAFEVAGRFKSSDISESETWLFGEFDGAYPDLEVDYTEKDNFLYKLVFGVNACDVNVVGYGNCVKQCVNGGQTTVECMVDMELCKDQITCNGNANALTGSSNRASDWEMDNMNIEPIRGNNGQIVGWKKPERNVEQDGDEGESGGDADDNITLTITSESDWTLNIAGYEVKDLAEIEKLVKIEDEHRSIIQGCINLDASNELCKIKLVPVQVNFLQLITEHKDSAMTCIRENKCDPKVFETIMTDNIEKGRLNITGIQEAKTAITEFRKVIDTNTQGGGLSEDFIQEPSKKFVTDDLSIAWLTDYNSNATEDEKYLLALHLGALPANLEGKDLKDLKFVREGNRIRVLYNGRDFGNTLLSNLDGIPLSDETLKKMGYNSNSSNIESISDPKTYYRGSVNEGFEEKINSSDTSEIIALMKSLGLDAPEIGGFIESEKITVNISSNGKVEFTYFDNDKRERVVKHNGSANQLFSNPQLVSLLSEEIEAQAPAVSSSDSSFKKVEKHIKPVTTSDFIDIKGSDGSQIRCLNNSKCQETDASALANNLNKSKDDNKYPGTFIVVNGVGEGNQSTVMYVPTEDELNKLQQLLDEDVNNFEDLLKDLNLSDTGSFLRKLIKRTSLRTYAQETESGEGRAFFLPEYGLFSLQLGGFEFSKQISDGLTFYLFYVETNGKEGFQMPLDPDNPTIYEDRLLKSNSFEIGYDKIANLRKYDLNKGINIISFDFIPVSSGNERAYSARDIVENAKSNGTRVEYISYFEGGRWIEGYKCDDQSCIGTNFTIIPGRGYLLKVSEKGSFNVSAYNINSPIPLNLSAGWNLVGVHGYQTAFTAKSLIDSVNSIDGITADNVSWYPTSKGRYEGLQVSSGVEYGLDFPISPINGYFIRVSDFSPTDESCRSLIWHAGSTLHGTCGDTRSIF